MVDNHLEGEHSDMSNEDPDERGKTAESPRDRSIEPGTPRLENVFFVLLGALLTVFAFLRGLGFV